MTRAARRPAFYCLVALLAILVPAWAAGWAEEADRLRSAGRWSEAISTLEPVARSGDAQAQAMLGNLLLARSNPARDEPAGTRWLRRAARQGNVNALATVGYPVPYVAQARLACGNATLTVMTSCRGFAPGEGPFCFAQTFLFESSAERALRRAFTETHADSTASPLLAVQMGCAAPERDGFVVEYSNFGNGRECTGCEERRHFDSSGAPVRAARRGGSPKGSRTEQISRFPAPAALESWFRE